MFLLLKFIDLRRLIVIVDSPFPSISFYVCQFVDAEGVLLVYWCAVNMFARLRCLLRCLILDESVTGQLALLIEIIFGHSAYPSVVPSSFKGM